MEGAVIDGAVIEGSVINGGVIHDGVIESEMIPSANPSLNHADVPDSPPAETVPTPTPDSET